MIDITSASSTATVCENMALFGTAPERGERDTRIVWDEDDATAAMSEAIRVMVNGVTVDGTQMADEREPLMWGLVNMLHSQVQRLDRAVDRIVPEMKDLQTAQDGSEVKAHELEILVDRAQNLGDRRDAFEKMRDIAADAYRAETGDTWRPRNGSHVSKTGALTSAAIDARDFQRARKDRETRAHLPEGTLVAITGGKTVTDADAVWSTLDKARAKHGDMVLVQPLLRGGAPAEAPMLIRSTARTPGGSNLARCGNPCRRLAPGRTAALDRLPPSRRDAVLTGPSTPDRQGSRRRSTRTSTP